MTVTMQERYKVAAWLRDACLQELKPNPRSIAIFGSFAGRALRKESDIDLLIVGDSIPKKPFARAKWFNPVRKKFIEEHKRFYSECPTILSPVFISERGWTDAVSLRLSVSQEGWTLWDDGFLSESLVEAARWIRVGTWERVDAQSGGWFWIKKEPAA